MITAGSEPWLLLLLAKSILISALFLGIGITLRRSSAAVLRMWWRGAFVSLIVVTAVSFAPALWQLPVSYRVPAQEHTASPMGSELQRNPATALAMAESPDAKDTPSNRTDHRTILRVIISLWALGAVGLLCRLLFATLRVQRLIARARTLTGSVQERILYTMRPTRDVALFTSTEAKSPFTAGIARGIVVLPEQSDTWNPEESGVVLRHELAHVENRDVAWQTVATIVSALLWVNPLVWLLHSRLLKAQEAVADDAVLEDQVDATEYAEVLLRVAAHARELPMGCAAAPMARQSTLGWRVARLLDRSQRRGSARTIEVSAAVAITIATIFGWGFVGLRSATADAGGAAESPKPVENTQVWTRKYRDTFGLTPAFAKRFPGTQAEAAKAFRKELEAKATGVSFDDVILELSKDKRSLTVEFPEVRSKEIEPALFAALKPYSLWEAQLEARQEAVDRRLRQFREEVEKQRAVVERRAIEMAQIREAEGIIDPDIEEPNTVLSHPDPGTLESKNAVSRYVEAKARYLNSKRILEAAELRLSNERMKVSP